MIVAPRLIGVLVLPAILSVAQVSAAALARQSIEVHHRSAVGDWELDVARNAFSGKIVCRLRAPKARAFYEGGAIGFRFDRDWDVSEAVYRIDGGPPRASRDDLPELTALGTPYDQGGMANPGQGVVRVPWRRIADANIIAIQPRRDRRVRTIRLLGLKGLRSVALTQGCTPDVRFVG